MSDQPTPVPCSVILPPNLVQIGDLWICEDEDQLPDKIKLTSGCGGLHWAQIMVRDVHVGRVNEVERLHICERWRDDGLEVVSYFVPNEKVSGSPPLASDNTKTANGEFAAPHG